MKRNEVKIATECVWNHANKKMVEWHLFKVLKRKKKTNLSTQNSILRENIFHKQSRNNDFSPPQAKANWENPLPADLHHKNVQRNLQADDTG